jgi:hypothetical protein
MLPWQEFIPFFIVIVTGSGICIIWEQYARFFTFRNLSEEISDWQDKYWGFYD